jgi:dUTP pyrophosphatase
MNLTFQIKRLRQEDSDIPVPSYMSEHASGMDLHAAVKEKVVLKPLKRAAIPTGFSVAVPEGFEAQVRPRSGLALKHGITVLNTPGTVDSDYRGEVMVILMNLGEDDFIVNRGDRIAQMVISRVQRVLPELSDSLPETKRGSGGFGHTGK